MAGFDANRRVRVTARSRRNERFWKRESEFDTEMAAPVEIEDPNWHRSKPLLKECEWKQGDSAAVNLGRTRKWRLSLGRA